MPGARRKLARPHRVKSVSTNPDNSKLITNQTSTGSSRSTPVRSSKHESNSTHTVLSSSPSDNHYLSSSPSDDHKPHQIFFDYSDDDHQGSDMLSSFVESYPSIVTPDINEEQINTTLYCNSACTLGRNNDREIILCSRCMIWHHKECTDFNSQFPSWTCQKCRCLPETVMCLKSQLSELHEAMSNMLANQNNMFSTMCNLNVENANLKLENKTLKKKLYDYRLQAYNKLTDDSDSESSEDESILSCPVIINKSEKQKEQVEDEPTPKEKPSLVTRSNLNDQLQEVASEPVKKPSVTVIGSSMVRGTGKRLSKSLKNHDSCVLSTSGYTLDNAISHIANITKEQNKGDIIVLTLGTVDVETCNHARLVYKFGQLVKITKDLSDGNPIIITAIPQRLNPESSTINNRIDQLNKSLRFMCDNDNKCWFIDCNPGKMLKNYKHDGLHFSFLGTEYFASKL